MITLEEFELLRSDEVRRAVAANIGRDAAEVALDRRVPHARLVATQVKYQARAATKLPSLAAAQCHQPPRAIEQASSEACAAHKRIEGEAVLDLTCGLGVDALALSRRFRRVTALERDPVLARITAHNLRLLGVDNVEVACASAEEFLARTTDRFDWVYADPDRRSDAGCKLVLLEECSPDVLRLRPAIERAAPRFCLQGSPLFEGESLNDECKEVVVRTGCDVPRIAAAAVGRGGFSLPRADVDNAPCRKEFDPARYGWLVVPDVALRKARLTCACLGGRVDLWSNDGYGFAAEHPGELLGSVFAVERIEPYDPSRLRRALRGRRAEILKRDFPWPAAEIARRIGVREGGGLRLAFTRIAGRFWTIWLK